MVEEQSHRLGRVEFLEKPFEHGELIERIDLCLAPKARFSGEIVLPLLSDLIQIVAISRDSGALSVTRGGQRGTLWFQKGQVEHCEVGDLVGRDAFRELMSWKEGDFRIRQGEAAPARTITVPTEQLLLESLCRMEEEAREAQEGQGPQPDPETKEAPPPVPKTAIEEAVVKWRRQGRALRLHPEGSVIAVSLAERRSIVLHGPERGQPAREARTAASQLAKTAASLSAAPARGRFESLEPGLGWVAAWNRDLELAVVYAQPVRRSLEAAEMRERGLSLARTLGVDAGV